VLVSRYYSQPFSRLAKRCFIGELVPNLNMSLSLKLFAHGINNLHDPNWTGMFLYDQVKQHLKSRVQPYDLLKKPLEKGFSYCLGGLIFDEYFSEAHIEHLHGEYKFWFVSDLCDFVKIHALKSTPDLISLSDEVNNISSLYETDEDEYWDYIDSKEFNRKALSLSNRYIQQNQSEFIALRTLYSEEFSDRMLHDRQLCFYASKLLVQIGFDGDADDTGPKQWVEREYWPERVKAILKSRDRGKCTNCLADLVMELDESIHIDHMIPISKGGCNDIVNLQILCSKCNLSKSAHLEEISSSIPRYIRRKKT
jgi:hypothetical protein